MCWTQPEIFRIRTPLPPLTQAATFQSFVTCPTFLSSSSWCGLSSLERVALNLVGHPSSYFWTFCSAATYKDHWIKDLKIKIDMRLFYWESRYEVLAIIHFRDERLADEYKGSAERITSLSILIPRHICIYENALPCRKGDLESFQQWIISSACQFLIGRGYLFKLARLEPVTTGRQRNSYFWIPICHDRCCDSFVDCTRAGVRSIQSRAASFWEVRPFDRNMQQREQTRSKCDPSGTPKTFVVKLHQLSGSNFAF